MAYIRSRKHASAAALAVLAIPAVLNAQTPPAQAKETVLPTVKVEEKADSYKAETVSSTKFTAPLVDTPQTVAVIKKELLREQGATTLQEALRNTPGVTILLGEGGNSNTKDNIFMRGFDSSGNIYTDGVRDLGGYVRDTFNTEQVEVLKGASGSEYGRGAASGSVNMSSKRPWAEDFTEASLTLGTADKKRSTVDVNRKFNDSSAGRINLMAQESGVAGRDEVENQSWGIAPSVIFGLGTNTRTTLSYLHSKQNNTPDGGVPTVGMEGFYNQYLAKEGKTSPPAVDRENFYGSTSDYQRIEADQFTLELEHDVNAQHTLRNTFRAGRSYMDQLLTSPSASFTTGSAANNNLTLLTPDKWTITRGRQLRRQENVLVTNQTNLVSKLDFGGIKHSLSTGAEVIFERQITPTLGGAGTMAAPSVFQRPNPNDPITGMNVAETGARSQGETFTLGLYAFDSVELNDQWQIHGGLRMDRYWVSNNNVIASTANSHPSLPVGTQLPVNIKDHDDLFTWKLGTVYKPAANGSIYASVSTSQQPPGGANFTLSADTANINSPSMDPSTAQNLELGTKWDFVNNRLSLTAALFQTTVENDLSRNTDGSVTQYGEKQVQGIELGAVGNLTDAWNISAGLAKMETEVKDGTATQTGASINWSPELTFTAWSTYQLPMGLKVGLGARYQDELVRSISNNSAASTTNMLSVPSYWVFDSLLGYEVNKNLGLQLNLYNIGDKDYFSSMNNNGNRYIPGEGRSAALTANLKF